MSRMVPVDQSSLFIPSADQYARAAVRRIGYEACCTPFWAHSLQWRFASLFPEAVLDAWRLSIGIHRRNKSFSCEEWYGLRNFNCFRLILINFLTSPSFIVVNWLINVLNISNWSSQTLFLIVLLGFLFWLIGENTYASWVSI